MGVFLFALTGSIIRAGGSSNLARGSAEVHSAWHAFSARTDRGYADMLHTLAVAQGISSDKEVDSCMKGSFPCPQVGYGNIKKGVLLKLCWEYGIMRNLPSARQMVYERRV